MTGRAAILALFVVLLLAAWLRLSGIAFGAPCARCRPDEELVLVETLFRLSGDPHVHDHSYPPGLSRLQTLWLGAADGLGLVPGGGMLAYAEQPMPFHVAARLLTALLGATTVLLTFLLAKEVLGAAAGVIAAAALAVMPLHVLDSHFATVDVPGTFFLVLCAAASFRWSRDPRARWLVMSGLAAGIAGGIKYPHATALLVPLLHVAARPRRVHNMGLLAASFAAGLLVAAPTLVLQTDVVIEAVRAEADRQERGQSAPAQGASLWFHLERGLARGAGLPIALLALWGVVQSVRARRDLLPLLAPAAALLLLHGLFGKALARYMVPLLPIVAVFAAAGATLTLPRLHPAVRIAFVAVLLALPAWTSLGIVSRLARTDTRGELLRAFEDARLPRDAPVFSPGYPFYPFPLAWDQAYLRQETLAVTECETRRAIQRDVANELLRADTDRFPRLEISLLAAPLLHADRAKLPDRFLLIVPEHFGGFDWWQDLRSILEEHAARQGHVVRSILRIEPDGGRPLPPREAYDAIDFGWWLPYPDARLVERPGPPIEVLLVEKR